MAAEKAISLANQVFGFNGWSSSIQNIQIDFVDENPQTGKISLGLSVIVRVTLKDGSHHEDIGYGQIENCKGKAAAFEKAKKEGTTDALKRALRNFGNVLGNCVYDKTYLAKVTKLKVEATKWDPDMLHRHSDFAPKKVEEGSKPSLPPLQKDTSAEFDDTFDLADFEMDDFDGIDNDHPDDVALPAEAADTSQRRTSNASGRMPPPPRADVITPSKPPVQVARPGATRSGQSSTSTNVIPQPLPGQRPHALQAQSTRSIAGPDHRAGADDYSRSSSPNPPPQQLSHQAPGNGGPAAAVPPRPAGFYSAKAAGNIDANNNIAAAAVPSSVPKFNPHAESPSIRKTSGVNHNRSVPLKRDLTPDTSIISPHTINPQLDSSRRVGAPAPIPKGQFATVRGPGASAYRPPTRRGPEANPAPAVGVTPSEPAGADEGFQITRRMPLGDVSNIQHNVTATTPDGADAKRQRIVEPGQTAMNGAPSDNPKDAAA